MGRNVLTNGDDQKVSYNTLPLQVQIGDLNQLQTTTKKSAVEAINELITNEGTKTQIGDLTKLTTSDKTDLVSAINDNVSQLAENANFHLPEMIKRPTGFSFPYALNIFKNSLGAIEVKDFDIQSFHPLKEGTGKAYYVSRNGLDTNNGTSLSTAFLTLNKAFSMTDLDILYIDGGEYYRQHNVVATLPARDIKIIALNTPVHFQNIGSSSAGALTWTTYSTGVYETQRSGCVGVFDSKILDQYNNFLKYTQVSTIALCQSTVSSWYTDGTNVYVHTSDGNMPLGDSDIKLAVTSNAGFNPNATNTYYFQGITFECMDKFVFNNANTVLFKDCTFRNMCSGNGLNVNGATLAICQDCLAYGNYNDGLNYANVNFLEVNCKGYGNGIGNTSTNNNNGSTSHNTTVSKSGVRVNGMYFENKGPNVADVQSTGFNNKTWNIGCVAYNSQSTDSGYLYDFQTTDEQWLDSCLAYGTPTSVIAVPGTGVGTSHIRNGNFQNTVTGTVANY